MICQLKFQTLGQLGVSLRADVSISFASRGKGRLRNAVPNCVPVSRCFSRIRGPRSDWFLNSRHC